MILLSEKKKKQNISPKILTKGSQDGFHPRSSENADWQLNHTAGFANDHQIRKASYDLSSPNMSSVPLSHVTPQPLEIDTIPRFRE